MNAEFSRRSFCKTAAAAAVTAWGFPAIAASSPSVRNVIIIGADGMDPHLLRSYMNAGDMPNCRRLAEVGCFKNLRTSDPPQSPVAWSNFISGANPGGHGIFDFIARDAATLVPHLSTSRTDPPEKQLRIGKYALPLDSAEVHLLRKGPTLWNLLQDAGIESTAFKIPVNYPPSPSNARTLAGITTPDIHGSYGIFAYYSSDPKTLSRDVSGGHIERVRFSGTLAECILPGPANSFRVDGRPVDVPFTVERDEIHRMARIRIQDRDILLEEGAWSDWVTLEFSMLKYIADVSGICRFYLKKVSPHLEMYVSPINIDPANPSTPICTPDDYSREIVDEIGHFYTQGMPEDTAALSAKVFSDDDFRDQATFVLNERMRLFDHEFNRYAGGFFFFYFSSLDLNSHAFWRTIDTQHPLYDPETAARHGDFLRECYRKIDEALGKAMRKMDEHTAVYLMSDHGFVSFRRQFNLNSWLMDNGFAEPRSAFDRGYGSFYQDVDWTRTRAYGLGINGLYLNIKGREPDGAVAPGEEVETVKTSLIQQLTALVDPQTGDRVISHVYRPREIYSGPFVNMAPDLVVCYNRNYRASWDTILGKYPKEHLLDNLDPWSGDHCMDAAFLPGVLISNRPFAANDPSLTDLAPSLLNLYGLPVPSAMTGRNLYA